MILLIEKPDMLEQICCFEHQKVRSTHYLYRNVSKVAESKTVWQVHSVIISFTHFSKWEKNEIRKVCCVKLNFTQVLPHYEKYKYDSRRDRKRNMMEGEPILREKHR